MSDKADGNTMTRRGRGLWSAGLLSVALVAGCVEQTAAPEVARAPVPDEFIVNAFEAATAENVAKSCRGKLRYNHAYEKAVIAGLERKYAADGKVPDWAKGGFRSTPELERRAQDWVLGYVQRRNILMSNQESWCGAGLSEIREQTRIGKYLIAR